MPSKTTLFGTRFEAQHKVTKLSWKEAWDWHYSSNIRVFANWPISGPSAKLWASLVRDFVGRNESWPIGLNHFLGVAKRCVKQCGLLVLAPYNEEMLPTWCNDSIWLFWLAQHQLFDIFITGNISDSFREIYMFVKMRTTRSTSLACWYVQEKNQFK